MTTETKKLSRDEEIAKFAELHDTISASTREAVLDKATEVTDTYLVIYGEPKEYRLYRHMGETFMESALLHFLEAGIVTLTPEHTASEEEQAERKAKREQAIANGQVAGRGPSASDQLQRALGAYL